MGFVGGVNTSSTTLVQRWSSTIHLEVTFDFETTSNWTGYYKSPLPTSTTPIQSYP